jgi:hypothetical protein
MHNLSYVAVALLGARAANAYNVKRQQQRLAANARRLSVSQPSASNIANRAWRNLAASNVVSQPERRNIIICNMA